MTAVTDVSADPVDADPVDADPVDADPVDADPVADPITDRLDALSRQVADLTDLIAQRRRDQDRWAELVHELVPVAQAAMQVASDELEELSQDVCLDDAIRFARTAVRTLPQLEAALVLLASAGELAGEVTSLGGAGMASLSQALDAAEHKGWFDAARRGGRVLDRMAHSLAEPVAPQPPSVLALARRLRDPQARRGLAVGLDLLAALGAEPTTTPSRPAGEKD